MNLRNCIVNQEYTVEDVESLIVEADDYSWHTGTGLSLGDCVVFHSTVMAPFSDIQLNDDKVVSFVIISAENLAYKCIYSNF